jgi:Spy/CpxP family protein refolding chaperone
MKINPELSSVINMVKKENGYQKKTQETGEQKQKVEDMVSVQNAVASRSQVENVEEARALLSDVMKDMDNTSTGVHELNQYRISRLIS